MKYAGFQSFFAITAIPFASFFSSRKDINRSIAVGMIGNIILACMACMVQLAWFPLIEHETLPLLTVCNQLSSPIYTILYSVMLALAFISTGVGSVFSNVQRFEKYLKVPANLKVRRAIIAVIFMLIATLISLLGLTQIVSVGYSYLGIAVIFTMIIPVLTVSHIRNKKAVTEAGKEN